ncbi:hypothetical protein AAE250_20860 [Bacteroides sp. GD17]|jgi:uncharacterized membrane protein|uniref:hypothetical protein n=1 Tax=Bacteroides sp. GD17 TaxID=3139826 RepID=UPI0020451DF9|nr:hypothetical protein [uncultured Bacteroides sp.]DAV89751.1 MAG TPA: hypothetical protein [Caudoviricetes sp.]
MEFTGDVIKTGQSAIGDFRLNYSISYNGENQVTNLEAQIKKESKEMTRNIGSISYVASTKRYAFSLFDATTSEERTAMFDDFEKTLAEVSCSNT